jgi:hypothetical protein
MGYSQARDVFGAEVVKSSGDCVGNVVSGRSSTTHLAPSDT